MNKYFKCILIVTILILLCSLSACKENEDSNDIDSQNTSSQEKPTQEKVTEIILNNPIIQEDSSMDAGQKVFFDCIAYGSYPQTEIVAEASQSGAYGKWGEQVFQVEMNGKIYAQLSHNDIWDSDNNTIINDVKYTRIKKEDAYCAYDDSNYNYQWDSNYHYFRYDSVKWRVLNISDDKILILSDVILDASYAKENLKEVETLLFSDTERKNFYDNSQGLFLLDKSQVSNSDESIAYGFIRNEDSDDEGRKSKASMYAIARGIGVETHSNRIDHSEWWVNDVEDTFVSSSGSLYAYNYEDRISGLRPAIWLNKSEILWTYAGSVCSDATIFPENLRNRFEINKTDSTLPDFQKLEYGNVCNFGLFKSSNKTESLDPIEWIVYEKTDQYVKLITKDAIDCRPFHYETTNITWEKCSLREWLNTDFYNAAFSEKEKEYISKEYIPAHLNSKYPDLDPGNDTNDYVFLLSVKEAEEISPEILSCKATAYAISRGSFEAEQSKNTWWWLRSPGDRQSNAAAIITDGSIDYEGNSAVAELDNSSVRPCITILYRTQVD